MWDKTKALATLHSQVLPASHGLCARYTRQAVEAGGVVLGRVADAKDYGPSLVQIGFQALTNSLEPAQAADVGIVQPIPGHPDGHMAMFDGQFWISDFKQLHGLYPGPGYRQLKPPFALYRFPAQ